MPVVVRAGTLMVALGIDALVVRPAAGSPWFTPATQSGGSMQPGEGTQMRFFANVYRYTAAPLRRSAVYFVFQLSGVRLMAGMILGFGARASTVRTMLLAVAAVSMILLLAGCASSAAKEASNGNASVVMVAGATGGTGQEVVEPGAREGLSRPRAGARRSQGSHAVRRIACNTSSATCGNRARCGGR